MKCEVIRVKASLFSVFVKMFLDKYKTKTDFDVKKVRFKAFFFEFGFSCKKWMCFDRAFTFCLKDSTYVTYAV